MNEENGLATTSPGSEGGRLRGAGELALAAGLLLLLAAAALAGPGPYGLGLYHDDWPHLYDVALGQIPGVNATDPRPLHLIPWKAAGAVFGHWLPGYYLLLFAVHWLTGVLGFVISRRWTSLPGALLVASLILVFPADASRFWLSSLPGRSALLLAVAAIWVAETARNGGTVRRPVGVAAACLLAAMALLVYELPLVLLAAWPLAAACLGRRWQSRAQLWAWEAVPLGYLLWRFLGRTVFDLPATAKANFVFEPLWLLQRLAKVAYNLIAEGWRIGLWEWVSQRQVWATLTFVVLCTVLWGARGRGECTGDDTTPGSWRLLLAAAVLIAAGIAPVVPTDHWIGRNAGTFAARIFADAMPGAGLALAVLVGRLRRPLVRSLVLAFLLTTAIAFHWEVRTEAVANARVQKDVANALVDPSLQLGQEGFVVVAGLPPNRLAYDMPFGFGLMIARATGKTGLSGIGLSAERQPGEILTLEEGHLLVHRGQWARVPLAQVRWLHWHPTPSGARLQQVEEWQQLLAK